MVYNIIYDAVKKKTRTTPPNLIIGNVEMAAGIGIVFKEIEYSANLEEITEVREIKEMFENKVSQIQQDKLSDTSRILIELIHRYQVKTMVNETLEDLKILIKY